jgi:hypothetical protein
VSWDMWTAVLTLLVDAWIELLMAPSAVMSVYSRGSRVVISR